MATKAATTSYYGTGHRKNATAKVWLSSGSGIITINDRPASEYFGRASLDILVHQPFNVTDTVGKYDVDRQIWCVVRQDLQVGVRREALGLTGLRRQIQRYQPPRSSAYQRRGQLRDQQVRQHAGKPRTGPEHHPVRCPDRLHGLRARGRVSGYQ